MTLTRFAISMNKNKCHYFLTQEGHHCLTLMQDFSKHTNTLQSTRVDLWVQFPPHLRNINLIDFSN